MESESKRVEPKEKKKPLVCLVVGMAGTGKTTLVQRFQLFSDEMSLNSYFINLDPAVTGESPFGCHIDIRDTVNYKEVMKQYRLGPNGGIMTSLNLFATKFHQVIQILEQKEDLDYVFVDTPGQIEVFTWSASGQLISEAFASTFPTCVIFVGDTSRCTSPQTFMSTMTYSSSILYKMQLPLLLAFNKCDAVSGDYAVRWLRDSDSLIAAARGTAGFSATLTQSLALFVHEFYQNMHCCCVSAVTGEGIAGLFSAGLSRARVEFETEFLPLVQKRQAERAAAQATKAATQAEALLKDIAKSKQ